MENSTSVQSLAAVVAARAQLTSADSGIVGSEPETVMPPRASYRSDQPLTYGYMPAGPSVMLTAAILEAVPEILDQHDRYSQAQLVYYLQTFFPEIPEQLCAPVVLAATAGAKQASLLHNVHEKNMQSQDPRKREFAAEAGNALSFWAFGLRPAHRSAGAFNQTADNVLPMPLHEPPIEFGGTMAAVVPCPSPIDVSNLLDSVALPVSVLNMDNEFQELLAVHGADED